MESWFSPRDITFTRDQVIWLIQQLELLSNGIWPSEPLDTHYTDIGRSSLKDHAYFETPCSFSAEITYRLQRTGIDGKLLIAELMDKWHPVFYQDLQPESKKALNYVSIFDFRKRAPYWQWKKQRDYYSRKYSTKK